MTSTRTNLGPLTTAFTYPASCTNNVIQCSTCAFAWQAQTCSNNPNNAAGVQDNANCWPPRQTSSSLTTGVALNGWGVYSPGLSCPVGYNTACSATGTTIGGFQFQFPVSADETGIGCCPSGYTCSYGGSGSYQTCFSVATTGSFSAVQCSAGSSIDLSYYTLGTTATITTTGTTTVSASGTGSETAHAVTNTGVDLVSFNSATLLAPMFQLVHRAGDLPSSGTSGAATENTSPAHTTGAGVSDSGSNGLSSGAIAGIAVGAVVVGLALVGAFVYLFLKQRKQKRMIAQYAPPPNMSGNMGMSPHDGMSPHGMQDGSYFNGATPLSMKSNMVPQPSPVYEAPTESHQRHELA